MKIRVNGIHLNYRIDGPEGAPWVTMSNSLATTHRMWDAQLDAFTKQYRVRTRSTRRSSASWRGTDA